MSAVSQRFAGIQRLYGATSTTKISQANVCVIGIGGVGSWIVEGLVRSAIGQLTIIDLDDIAVSNINRQIHALESTLDQSKVEVIKSRMLQINPDCSINDIEDFVTTDNVTEYINLDKNFDVVIDATDNVKAKAAIVARCKRLKIKVICIGGAGGQTDPLQISKADLAKTKQDPLLAKVRSELRRNYGFSTNLKRNFGVECIYSTEQLKYPDGNGEVTTQKQLSQGASKMDCATGFGASVGVTASFGMIACSRALHYLSKS